ncbi:phosphotransferase [Shewanella sp. Scap07]|uniref:aminoglycoside phosphotransferase family protein n=1 Tax=Shewanella sp. Scap07 TaxID=2589987 RepID=UPI0015BAADD2|nr:phosphotransferase [Shewanella sp. Scap07]QLE84410.1 phosphotransferase [Shewanella sp. Scap07]
MPLSDPRFIALESWLATILCTNHHLELISGDASFRRYFRVHTETGSYIAMDSPPELTPVQPFIDLAAEYQRQGLLAPQVIEQHLQQGFLLLSDLGDTQLLSCLDRTSCQKLYAQAIDLLLPIMGITSSNQMALPLYDEQFVARELTIFTEWLLAEHLNLALSASEQQMLDTTFALLTANALEQPTAGMHRDYHSRNLMVQSQQLAVIDFQDAVIGPVTYDAVSLLRDCYSRCPDDVRELMMLRHYQLLVDNQYLSIDTSFAQYQRWFDLMGMQRHIKAAGIFCRLNYRDHKPAYMADIPMTLSYIIEVAAKYSELSAFGEWVEQKVLVNFEAQQ